MTKLIVANWKSHKTLVEAKAWWSEFSKTDSARSSATVIVCPPFPFLSFLHDSIGDTMVSLGVQDLSPFPAGAYTGAISAQNLQDLGVTYAILGHSERRRYFHETHQEIANKVDQALQAGIKPILCLDEAYLMAQSSALSSEQMNQCVVAYEPLEAIGSGINEPVEQVNVVVEKIREAFGQVPVIYGGSVSAENVKPYLEITDGVLVATHSLEAADFAKIVAQA